MDAGAGVEADAEADGAGAGGADDVACSPDCSSLGFLREAAVVVDFSRGRRGARAGFSLSLVSLVSLVSLLSFSFLGLESGSSSFLRRDRLAPEARRALDPSALVSVATDGPSSLGNSVAGGSVDMVGFSGEL